MNSQMNPRRIDYWKVTRRMSFTSEAKTTDKEEVVQVTFISK